MNVQILKPTQVKCENDFSFAIQETTHLLFWKSEEVVTE